MHGPFGFGCIGRHARRHGFAAWGGRAAGDARAGKVSARAASSAGTTFSS